MKRIIAAVLMACMLLSLTACAAQAPAATPAPTAEATAAPEQTEAPAVNAFTPGTYTATAQGMRGPIKVEVTFSADKLESINVLEHEETIRIGEMAVKLLPDEIVNNQSLQVDDISSATISSAAIKQAVADCIAQAGGDADAWRKAPVNAPEAKDETFDYDVVVVGGGLSGLTAALAAAEEGAKVALLEKQPFLGGTSVMAEGYFFSTANSDSDGLYNLFLARATEATSTQFPEHDMLRVLADNSTPALDMIRSTGLQIEVLRDFTSIVTNENGEIDTSSRSAYRLIDYLSKAITDKNGDIYLSTPATELISKDGVVTGVIAETKLGKKTFNAKNVILASGDYGRNKEMVEKYIPQSSACFTITASGNTGDGIEMALKVGAQMYPDQYMQGGPLIFNPLDIYRGSYSNPEFLKTSLLVSLDGDRRVGEDQGTRPVHYSYTNGDEPDGAWSIMDSNIVKDLPNIDELLAATTETSYIKAYKADTLFDLALMAGLNPEVFIRSVNRYNSLCAAGEDTDFGKDPSLLIPIEQGPFYAVRGYAISRGTLGGIRTNTNAQVVDEAGQPIPGLYAAGTISSRAFFSRTYHGGSALGISATMGYVAGKHAAQ